MILIQLILILGFMVLLYRVLVNPVGYQLRAMTKILAILFIIIAVITVIFPNATNTIAHAVGVSRGADLLLYILTLAFIFAMFNSYIQSKRNQERMVHIVRALAISEANNLRHNQGLVSVLGRSSAKRGR